MKTKLPIVALAICLFVVVAIILDLDICDALLNLNRAQLYEKKKVCSSLYNREGGVELTLLSNAEGLLREFAGRLRACINRTSFDISRFESRFNKLNEDFQNLTGKVGGAIAFPKISKLYDFTARMFSVMKQVCDYREILNENKTTANEILYLLFELKILLFTLCDHQGILNLRVEEYKTRILEFHLSLKNLETSFALLGTSKQMVNWIFQNQVKKVGDTLRCLWLQIPIIN